MGFLIDTCIWVDVERGSVSPADIQVYTKQEPVFISPVTIAELTSGMEMAADQDIRSRRLAALERLKKKPILYIDEVTGELFGQLAAAVRKNGGTASHRAQDLWLASQAVQHGYNLLTRNEKDFRDIPGLNLVIYGR